MKRMNRRDFIKYASAGIGACAVGITDEVFSAESRGDKPNIVFIFADEMRYSAMGCMGNSDVKTPNLDRLAEEGMLFTNALSSGPVCTPYRAQLLTGRYSHSTGVIRNDIRLPANEITIAEAFKEQGYATGYIGKWHLDAGRKEPKGTDRRDGFVPPGPYRQGWDYWAALGCSHNYFHTKYYRDNAEPIMIDGYEPDVQTDLAVEYIKQHRRQPFCLMMSWGPPHFPFKAPDRWDIYDPEKLAVPPNVPSDKQQVTRELLAQYYGMVTSIDACMNRIVNALSVMGLADNTIVCFTSDHGDMIWSHNCEHKQRPWEESIHIPFIMRWPRKIKPGQKKDVLFNSVDVMPTLLGLCGIKGPAAMEGTDLSGVILGTSNKEPDSAYLAIWAVQEDGSVGSVTNPGVDWRGVRTKEWAYAYTLKGDWILYNIKQDPYQLNNLVDDPKHQAKKAEMRQLVEQWRTRLGDDHKLRVARPDAYDHLAPSVFGGIPLTSDGSEE